MPSNTNSDAVTAGTYQSAADCPLGAAHGMASTHHNAADEWVCDWCGFPVEDDPAALAKARPSTGDA